MVLQRFVDHYPMLERAYLDGEVDADTFYTILEAVVRNKEGLEFKNSVVRDVIFGVFEKRSVHGGR